uniref:GOLD domain-containing protein n=1 Tax=Lagenidium giganteum TaxID=4803 RepID=A0AAV2YLL5_9STRA
MTTPATPATEEGVVSEHIEEEEEEARPVETEANTLDVVVTAVEAASAPASALSALTAQTFTVELVVSAGGFSYCIQRSLVTLLALLNKIGGPVPAIDASDPAEVLQVPEFPWKDGRNSDASLARWCAAMTAYLLAARSKLDSNKEWLAFTREEDAVHGARTQMTAIGFILQPFPYERIYVPRGSKHELIVQPKREGQFIVWKFEVDDHDIDFSVSFTRHLDQHEVFAGTVAEAVSVHASTRYMATPVGRPIEGMYQCPASGRATLVWDNSYSRIRGKNILYQVHVVDSRIMESASAAADALSEAVEARRKAMSKDAQRDDEAAEGTLALLGSSTSFLLDTSTQLYKNLVPERLTQHSWFVSAPVAAASRLAARLFGSQDAKPDEEGQDRLPVESDEQDSSEGRSLLEELNGLNMQLLERLEGMEDNLAKLTVERDQARSRIHVTQTEKENVDAQLAGKELEVTNLRAEIQRIQKERDAWREVQAERDALLEEKHRWAMEDDIEVEQSDSAVPLNDLDNDTRTRLERELGQAEASVLTLRAELGYSLTNHLTGTSTRLEKIARDMTATKKEYEDKMKAADEEVVQLKQQIVKFRSQKRVLVTEIRNMKTQFEGQISVAMAEASEARMVNRRLKKQNELLLTQIRSLVDEARDREKQTEQTNRPVTTEPAATSQPAAIASEGVSPDSDVPYTLTEADIALLNGRPPVDAQTSPARSSSSRRSSASRASRGQSPPSSPLKTQPKPKSGNPFRSQLVAFFEAKDPAMLPQVDELLDSYRGVETSLFESLVLKYSILEMASKEET